jgi:hypothetical protein
MAGLSVRAAPSRPSPRHIRKANIVKARPAPPTPQNPACGRVLIYKMGFFAPAAKESKADGTG